jgi:hypothetical protein
LRCVLVVGFFSKNRGAFLAAMGNFFRPENWCLQFIGLNSCIIFSLAAACVLHVILSAWGRGRKRKDESKSDAEED